MDTRTRVRTLYDFINGPHEAFAEPLEPLPGDTPLKPPSQDTVVIQKGVHELLAQLYSEAEQSNFFTNDRP